MSSLPDVAKKHQRSIARRTLQFSDVGALIMGGMTKDEARAILGPRESNRIESDCDLPAPYSYLARNSEGGVA